MRRSQKSDRERLKDAREDFKERGHKATLVLKSDRFVIIDWRRANGSGEYYINYIIDKDRGSLFISGDLGDCIATWYSPNSVNDIAGYITSVSYFMEKFQCASNAYRYDCDDVIDDIFAELKACEAEESEEFAYDWEDFKDSVPDSCDYDGFHPDDEQREFLDKYLGQDWWEGASSWGQDTDTRVFLWIEGLNMAVDQLIKDGVLTKKD